MVIKIAKSRRLFLLLGICLIDTYSTPSDLIPLVGTNDYSQSDPFDGHTMWIVDENSGECLSSHGFGACGDVNLWKWRSRGWKSELVMFESVLPPIIRSNTDNGLNQIAASPIELPEPRSNMKDFKKGRNSQCLGRIMSISKTHPETTLSKCSSMIASATTWEYDHENMMLSTASGILSKFTGSLCIVRDGDAASTQNCNMGYTRLYLVIHTTRTPKSTEELERNPQRSHPKTHLVENGEYTCSKSGLTFPRNLDGRVASLSTKNTGKHEDRQIFMGADLFTKTVLNYDFKVYSVGWYVEVQGARKDSSLKAFEGLGASELSISTDFYTAMVTNAAYDRTIFIKLAMALQTDLMIRGLVEELQISSKNSKLLFDASKSYEPKNCPKGLEVLFTWRYARALNGNRDILEIRIGGALHASLDEPGLAQDFFTQFVQPDPVSVLAKAAFVTGFPAVLNAYAQSPKSSEVIKNLKGPNEVHGKSESRPKIKKSYLFDKSKGTATQNSDALVWDGFAPSFYATAERTLVWWKRIKSAWCRKIASKKKSHMDSLLVTDRESKNEEEMIATVLIVFYLLLLLILSLPPAMIKRGKGVVAIVKRKIKKIQVAMKRTVSCTSLCTTSLMSSKLPYRKSVSVINAMT